MSLLVSIYKVYDLWIDSANQVFHPPSCCLYAHLPPRLLIIIVADTPGVSEQRAGQR